MLLFQKQSDGKEWMELLCGPSGATLEKKSKGKASLRRNSLTDSPVVLFNQQAAQSMAADTIQRLWRRRQARKRFLATVDTVVEKGVPEDRQPQPEPARPAAQTTAA